MMRDARSLKEVLNDNAPDGYCVECRKPFWVPYYMRNRLPAKKYCSRKCYKKVRRRVDYNTNRERELVRMRRWQEQNKIKFKERQNKWHRKLYARMRAMRAFSIIFGFNTNWAIGQATKMVENSNALSKVKGNTLYSNGQWANYSNLDGWVNEIMQERNSQFSSVTKKKVKKK
jgi:hypothetical protein